MGDRTRTERDILDQLTNRLNRLEAENEDLRTRLDEDDAATRRVTRRALLGGGVALGTAVAVAGPARAAAAPIPLYMELNKDFNAGINPTVLKGTIVPKRGDDLNVLTPAFRVVNQNTTGTAISVYGASHGVFASSMGVGVLSRSEGGVGAEGWVDGFADDPASLTTSGVWGLSSIDAAPAFLAGGDITLRTLENDGGIPDSDDARPGDLSIRTDGGGGSTWWVCVEEAAGGSPAQFVRVASPAAAGAFEALPAPIRVYDSRLGAPPVTGPKTPVVGPATRTVSCVENTAGAVPADARVVVVNLTATATSAAGFASVFPTGAAWAGTSNLNFAAGQTIANSVTVGCGPGASIDVRIGPAAVSADIIVDVMGFYR